jgi:hypothetical protein
MKTKQLLFIAYLVLALCTTGCTSLKELVRDGNILEAEQYCRAATGEERIARLRDFADNCMDNSYFELAAKNYRDAEDTEGLRRVAAVFSQIGDYARAVDAYEWARDIAGWGKAQESLYRMPKRVTIKGIVADASKPYGSVSGIPRATIGYRGVRIAADEQGRFSLDVLDADADPLLEMKAPGFRLYRERPSREVCGAFHLIPETLYRGVYLICWHVAAPNPHNWLRKWEAQTEFVIVRKGASASQIEPMKSALSTDEYRKLTGGRFSSKGSVTVVDEIPTGADSYGKTVIFFSPDVVDEGGIAHSDDNMGVIYYAEISWNPKITPTSNLIWHEMVHTVTAGGHINEWDSISSEIGGTSGVITRTDEKIMNCIYNSPPLRDN